MARTTVNLDPALIEQMKRKAAATRESMSQLLNRLIRESLERADAADEPPPFEWHVHHGAPAPGFDPSNRDYLDLLDDAE